MRTSVSTSNRTRTGLLRILAWIWVILIALPQCSLQTIQDRAAEALFLPSDATRPAIYDVLTERGAEFTTSDDVVLRADLHRPVGLATTPTILVRIPFTNTFWNRTRSDSIGRFWAARGYTVVVQGTRGRYRSGGAFEPLIHERRDGIETLDWLSKQPWYDGRLAMWGGSAFGHTQWAVADQADPGADAFFIQIASSSFRDFFHPGGAFALESALYWALRSHGDKDRDVDMTALHQGADAWPVLLADDKAGVDVDFFNDWAGNDRQSAFWKEVDGNERARHTAAPILLLGGWYDPFLPSMLRDFADLTSMPASAESRLIIGPYAHAEEIAWPGMTQRVPYRRNSVEPALRWFDRHLGLRPDEPPMAPVRIFVLGANRWRDENEWPLARTEFTPFYFHDGGVLRPERPASADGSDVYDYDPRNPVPTRGGAMLGPDAGPVAQAAVGERPDVISYLTPASTQTVELTGPVKVVLWVTTDAPSTDFTAKLSAVLPDGDAYNLTDGILRRSYAPGETTRIEIDLGATSVALPVGHRLRLDISSSNHPRFDRNPNTGESASTATQTRIAHQIIRRAAPTPSHIVLPIIPQ